MTTICNVCGHSCVLGPKPGVPKDGRSDTNIKADMAANPHYWDEGGLINHTVIGGYNSTPGNGEGALDDCTRYTFSICEFCLDWLFTAMRVPPKVQSIHDRYPQEVYRSAAQRVKEDEWRKAKEEFEAKRFQRAISRKMIM